MPDYSKHKEYTIDNVGAGGLRLDKKAWQLADHEWADCLNVQFARGGVQRVRAWADFGTPSSGQAVLAGYGFKDEESTRHGYIVVGNRRIWKKSRLLGVLLDASWIDLSGADFPNLLSHALLGIKSEVGFETFRVSTDRCVFIAPQNNAIWNYNLTTDTAAALAGSPPQALDIVVYGERAILGRLRSGSPTSLNEFRWSAQGNPTSWNAADNTKAERLPSSAMKVKRTGQYLLIWKPDGIERVLITPDAAVPYRTDIVDDGIGLVQANAIGQYRNADYFVGPNSFYKLEGLRITDIGGPVRAVINVLMTSFSCVGVFTYGNPLFDEILFSSNNATGQAGILAYSPMWNTWSQRDMGGQLTFIAVGYDSIGVPGYGTYPDPRSFFSGNVNSDKVYRLTTDGTYPTGFPTTSNVKSGWRNFGTIQRKRITAHMPKFTRNTGTTMTIEYRTFNNTTDDPNPTVAKTATAVLDGTDLLIPLNLDARWVEVKYINNNNSQPWELTGESWLGDVSSWH